MENKKQIIIIIDHLDPALIAGEFKGSSDFLAMTPAAMLACEKSGLSYLTFNDLCDYRDFRAANLEFLKDLETFLGQLDRRYEKALGFPYAFSGNILWFITFFDNLIYLSRVCAKIKSGYSAVKIAGSSAYNSSLDIEVDFSQDGLAFHRFNEGLVNRVSMVRAFLDPEWIGSQSEDLKSSRPKRAKESLFFRIPRAVNILKQEAALLFAVLAAGLKKRMKGSLLVIQGAYEVRLLKKYLPEFRYLYPVKKLIRGLAREPGSPGIEPLWENLPRDFANKWCPGFEDQVRRLFDSYHDKILVKIPLFVKRLEEEFARRRPRALFYAICANKLYEFICAWSANKNRIPVFYFQHGGFLAFYRHPFLKYTEHDFKIEKVNIFQSKTEREICSPEVSSASKALGSIKLYGLYRKIKRGRRKTRNALYCTGPFNFYNYRDLMTNVSDNVLFGINKDIINAVRKHRQRTDIKVHPNGGKFNREYFNDLVKGGGSGGISVLKGGQAEDILGDYRLLILDYIGSALVPAALVLDIPVIIYLKDLSYLRKETFPDLEKAFYLARDKEALDGLLGKFAQGGLPSKFSEELLNKYVFPTDAGNPAVNIADFIRGYLN